MLNGKPLNTNIKKAKGILRRHHSNLAYLSLNIIATIEFGPDLNSTTTTILERGKTLGVSVNDY